MTLRENSGMVDVLPMRKTSSFFDGIHALGMCLCVILGVTAFSVSAAQAVEAVPKTKCVTTATKKLHADALARMEKDIAPYANSASIAPVIERYREVLAMAWEAMEEPYCGYGAYGSASAAKSYSKTAQGARSAFLTEVKKAQPKASKTVTTPPKTVPATPEVKAPPVPPQAAQNPRLRSGLFQGMRSTDVAELQKKLNAHFGTAAELPVTGFFGPMTRAQVLKFQLQKGIIKTNRSAGAGQVGPKTADALNAL